MANKDVVIPVVFPDYLITVDTPEMKVEVPNVLPWADVLPGKIKIPATKNKVPYLGHAGVLFLDGGHGLTKYFEYGRYDPAAKGLVRRLPVPDVKMGTKGRPTRMSLERTLQEVSRHSGQNGRITGAYIELDSGAFIKMLGYAESRMKSNGDPKRPPYEILSNSCLHFAKGVAEAGGARMPWVLAPQPAGYIIEVRLQEHALDLDSSGHLTVEGVDLD